jgi:hypothetical protein
MEDLLRFLKTYEVWIYALLGVFALFYLRKLILAWQEWQKAIFGMERENAQRHLSAALSVVGLLGIMILAQFTLVSFIAPAYPQLNVLATPTLDLLAEPTSTLSVFQLEAGTAPAAASNDETSAQNGCIPGQIEWSRPIQDEEVSGSVPLKGTIQYPSLGFYKFEYAEANSKNWVTIAAANEKKTDEDFNIIWNTSQLVPGDYKLRIVVTDNQNIDLLPCEISVRVVAEQ